MQPSFSLQPNREQQQQQVPSFSMQQGTQPSGTYTHIVSPEVARSVPEASGASYARVVERLGKNNKAKLSVLLVKGDEVSLWSAKGNLVRRIPIKNISLLAHGEDAHPQHQLVPQVLLRAPPEGDLIINFIPDPHNTPASSFVQPFVDIVEQVVKEQDGGRALTVQKLWEASVVPLAVGRTDSSAPPLSVTPSFRRMGSYLTTGSSPHEQWFLIRHTPSARSLCVLGDGKIVLGTTSPASFTSQPHTTSPKAGVFHLLHTSGQYLRVADVPWEGASFAGLSLGPRGPEEWHLQEGVSVLWDMNCTKALRPLHGSAVQDGTLLELSDETTEADMFEFVPVSVPESQLAAEMLLKQREEREQLRIKAALLDNQAVLASEKADLERRELEARREEERLQEARQRLEEEQKRQQDEQKQLEEQKRQQEEQKQLEEQKRQQQQQQPSNPPSSSNGSKKKRFSFALFDRKSNHSGSPASSALSKKSHPPPPPSEPQPSQPASHHRHPRHANDTSQPPLPSSPPPPQPSPGSQAPVGTKQKKQKKEKERTHHKKKKKKEKKKKKKKKKHEERRGSGASSASPFSFASLLSRSSSASSRSSSSASVSTSSSSFLREQRTAARRKEKERSSPGKKDRRSRNYHRPPSPPPSPPPRREKRQRRRSGNKHQVYSSYAYSHRHSRPERHRHSHDFHQERASSEECVRGRDRGRRSRRSRAAEQRASSADSSSSSRSISSHASTSASVTGSSAVHPGVGAVLHSVQEDVKEIKLMLQHSGYSPPPRSSASPSPQQYPTSPAPPSNKYLITISAVPPPPNPESSYPLSYNLQWRERHGAVESATSTAPASAPVSFGGGGGGVPSFRKPSGTSAPVVSFSSNPVPTSSTRAMSPLAPNHQPAALTSDTTAQPPPPATAFLPPRSATAPRSSKTITPVRWAARPPPPAPAPNWKTQSNWRYLDRS